MDRKQQFVEENLRGIFQRWLVRISTLGAIIFLLLSALDRIVVPHLFGRFLVYRVAIALLLLAAAEAVRRTTGAVAHRVIGALAILSSAAVIEAMILQFGGHASSYYVGMILLGICVLGFIPADTGFHVGAAASIYLVYLVPILLTDTIEDVPAFVTENFFMVVIFASAVLLRHFHNRSLVEELSLRFDLDRERRRLEEAVAESTAQLERTVEALRQEIRHRTATEESLSEILWDWSSTLDATSDAILSLNADLAVRRCNKAARDLLGSCGEALEGRPLKELLASSLAGDVAGPVLTMLRSRHRTEGEFRLGGGDAWMTVTADPILAGDGAFNGAVLTLRDTSERKRLQEAIARGKQEWEETFDIINDAITIHDIDFTIVRANRAAAALLGVPMQSIIGRPCFQAYHGTAMAPAACQSCKVRQSGEAAVGEIHEAHLGKHLEIKALPRLDREGRVVGFVHIVRDITARKESELRQELLQTQLLQSQKLEAIGRLAGGVAHDFNNILMAILGYCELVAGMLADDHPAQERLRIIVEAAERAASLSRQLLAFGRKQVLDVRPLRLEELVEDSVRMLDRLVGENYVLDVRCDGSVDHVLADRNQVAQVVMNLVLNARDALDGGGRIIVGVRGAEPGRDPATGEPGSRPGRHVELFVADDGPGMSEEVRQRIFEPFFTTKPVGKGSGLGLATVYGIVTQHNGFVEVESAPGEGTTMRVFFPASPMRPSREEALPGPGVPAGGTETILVVEDERSIRDLIRYALKPAGYRLLLASDGQEALGLMADARGPIDLLLTDVVMPKLDGPRLAERFRERRPQAPVLFMSGYAADFVGRQELEPDAVVLEKPFRPSTLLQAVRAALDSRPTGAGGGPGAVPA